MGRGSICRKPLTCGQACKWLGVNQWLVFIVKETTVCIRPPQNDMYVDHIIYDTDGEGISLF